VGTSSTSTSTYHEVSVNGAVGGVSTSSTCVEAYAGIDTGVYNFFNLFRQLTGGVGVSTSGPFVSGTAGIGSVSHD
jgi:hypothetical protein